MRQRGLGKALLVALLGIAVVLSATGEALALKINDQITLTARAYANARISTMDKQSTRPAAQPWECNFMNPNATPNPDICNYGGTFPYTPSGTLMQNRYFVELKWMHDVLPYVDRWLPSNVSSFRYYLTYRGEYDGIYDFGPNAYVHQNQSLAELEQRIFDASNGALRGDDLRFAAQQRLDRSRNRLRAVAPLRNRLFQAFVDWEEGPFFLRFGRQNLVWGETDVFRLLDNINPVDNSFGGFFLDLDERRVPLDMLRMSYQLGTLGPLDQAFFEGYVAMDRTVAFIPGAPAGSPWAVPLGPPTGQTLTLLNAPALNGHNLRGGGRFVFNALDTTFTVASYQTMFDTQAVRFRAANPTDPGYIGPETGVNGFRSVIAAEQFAPLVWVTGASMTTALPSLFSVLRAEIAFNKGEAFFNGPTETGFSGKGLTGQYVTEFLGPVTARDKDGNPAPTFNTVARRNSFGMALGWDTNQFIRWLNPNQTFFITTQFFWKHIFNYGPNAGCASCRIAVPVPEPNNPTRVVPQVQDSFLQTLAISTTYGAKVPFTEVNMQVIPGFNMFYDWQGMFVFQPNVRFIRDPWRLIMDYSAINSGVFRRDLGLVRDRSNVRFQVEYVL